jgi:REP element-mobilizing transposase RayT
MVLFAFVLMPSHLHCILRPEDRTIGDLLQNFASFTAHAILHQIQTDMKNDLLLFFHEQRRESVEGHSIWQDVQAKNIYSYRFLTQKLEYIHQNPVAKVWGLVANRADYQYSSACFYDDGQKPIIDVDDIREYLS